MKLLGIALLVIVGLFILLAIPGPDAPLADPPANARAFAWNQDDYWRSLETAYADVVRQGCPAVDVDARHHVRSLDSLADHLALNDLSADDALLDSMENRFFTLGPYAAACPGYLGDYIRLATRLRDAIKTQSRHWDVSRGPVRQRLYRSLYGLRAGVEEATLHHPESLPSLLPARDEPSSTPPTMVQGVRVHSGDILVSRGGYPTSALIARGNDYPGSFSHIALVHVDSVTGAASTVEAHIERGVAISTAEEYLGDKKLRIMVLRPRADLVALVADPMLPHRAATRALERARRERIPYDFAMDYADPAALFCSEVASAAYKELGVTLWMGISTISSPGLRRWLSAFGVRNFETQEPSDLEYDPQLVVVAEWRNPRTLMQDHIDNAVIDAMLERAEAGDGLSYPWYQLPLVRIAKGFSWIVGRSGGVGPVPQGMSARAALRNKAFGERQRGFAAQVTRAADSLGQIQGYPPPYWRLLDLAREAIPSSAP